MSDEESQPKTLFQQLRMKLENNRLIVAILVLGVVTGGIAGFAKDITELWELFFQNDVRVGSPEHPVRLSSKEIRHLIAAKVEKGKLVEPTHPEFEGRSNTWYRAYYFEDGRMLYLRAVSRSPPETWEWYVDENGNLCRGPAGSESRSCRSVESIGDGRFRGVGFRTGKIRYEFYVEEGSPDAMEPKTLQRGSQ